MTPDEAAAFGRDLARHHRDEPTDGLPEQRLVAYAENTRHGDWSLRSALVRVAQPHPVVASAVLTLVRRLDAALAPSARLLERDTVATRPDLLRDDADRSDVVADSRASDLARVAHRAPDAVDTVIEAYRGEVQVDDELLDLVPVLRIAVAFDELCDLVTDWAHTMATPAPVDEIDRRCRTIHALMEAAGVPKEEIPEEYRRHRG